MHFIGVDLHKKVISACVLVRVADERRIIGRRILRCDQPQQIREFFAGLAPFQLVVEATSSYEWFVQLVEPLADRIVLAHPKKLRIIAESTKKTDKLARPGAEMYLDELKVSVSDRFVVEQLRESWRHFRDQLRAMDEQLRLFAKSGPSGRA